MTKGYYGSLLVLLLPIQGQSLKPNEVTRIIDNNSLYARFITSRVCFAYENPINFKVF